jgi:glycosyltransferase involved in cell wall biosynthesis
MKIAVNTRFLIENKLEGIGWYTHELLKRMVAAHPEVEFHFLFDRPYSQTFIYGLNVVAHVLQPPARHPFLWWIWFEISVTKALKNIKPDVFFSPDNFLSLRAKIPTVLTCHDLIPFHYPEGIPRLARWYYFHYWPKYIRKAAHVLSVSEATRQDVIAMFQLDNQRVTSVYNGIRSGFCAVSLDQSACSDRLRQMLAPVTTSGRVTLTPAYFLAAGSIHPRKNTARLIEAFNQFKFETKSDIKLVLAGRMMLDNSELEAVLSASKYRSEIILTGYITESELQWLTRHAAACVYVSLFEGFGLPIVEAMASGVPVITSDTSCMPEIAGNAALLVDPTNVPAIAQAMQQILSDDNLRNTLIQNGLERVRVFDWDAAAEQVFKVLCGVK